VARERQLTTMDLKMHARAQRIIGLALAACEKTVRADYEPTLRPAEKQHQPWLERVQQQLRSAYRLLESELPEDGPWVCGVRPLQPDITAAIAWRFTTEMLPDALIAYQYPRLASLSKRCEQLPSFLAAPFEG
jgi:glutathione S-transferase